jgi:hypothetical protein
MPHTECVLIQLYLEFADFARPAIAGSQSPRVSKKQAAAFCFPPFVNKTGRARLVSHRGPHFSAGHAQWRHANAA